MVYFLVGSLIGLFGFLHLYLKYLEERLMFGESPVTFTKWLGKWVKRLFGA